MHDIPNLTGLVDLYCERTADGLFAEPINLLSNIFFFVIFFVLIRRGLPTANIYRLLCYLILAIAIGSSLFHSFARFWALALDVGPIALFMLVYVVAYLRLVLSLPTSAVIGYTLLFVVITGALRFVKIESLNHSEFYFSPLIVLAMMVVNRYRQGCQSLQQYTFSFSFFVFAIFFRILDMHICPVLAIGTHFMWHVCNAGCLYWAMQGLMTADSRRV